MQSFGALRIGEAVLLFLEGILVCCSFQAQKDLAEAEIFWGPRSLPTRLALCGEGIDPGLSGSQLSRPVRGPWEWGKFSEKSPGDEFGVASFLG